MDPQSAGLAGKHAVSALLFLELSPRPQSATGVRAPLDGVTFFTQYYYTLPGCRVRVVLLALPASGSCALACRRTGSPDARAPGERLLDPVGRTETGMLREGLHVPFAFLMLAWLRVIPLPVLTRPVVNWARAAELILFLWFPVFISNQRLTSPKLNVDRPARSGAHHCHDGPAGWLHQTLSPHASAFSSGYRACRRAAGVNLAGTLTSRIRRPLTPHATLRLGSSVM